MRTRQDEAATMLTRVAIETLITGLYCLHELTAVAQLQDEQMRMLPFMVKFIVDAEQLSRDVLDECIERLDLGDPAKGPDVASIAKRVDTATGSSIATNLHDRFYRPMSNLAVHADAASLLRHVRSDGRTHP